MVLGISSMIATMTNPHPCPRVLDDIDSLQRIVSIPIGYIDDFSSKS